MGLGVADNVQRLKGASNGAEKRNISAPGFMYYLVPFYLIVLVTETVLTLPTNTAPSCQAERTDEAPVDASTPEPPA